MRATQGQKSRNRNKTILGLDLAHQDDLVFEDTLG